MEQKFIYFLVCFFTLSSTYAQPDGISWLRKIGAGTDLRDNAILRNGNFISVGSTGINTGISAGNHGLIDCFVTCTTPDGIVLWKKTIGGTQNDGNLSVSCDTTTDGNILIGFTAGSNNGDISGNHGSWDIAVFKYDINGNLLWSKTFGGDKEEILGAIAATSDGGGIMIGHTESSNSGDILETNHGAPNTTDIWIVKFDANGAIQWQKLFGGSLNEAASVSEYYTSIVVTDAGEYIFATSTQSTDGDLTGVLPSGTVMGAADIWLAKLNSAGGIIWQKVIGGSDVDNRPKLYTANNAVYLMFDSRSSDRDLSGNLGLSDLAIFKYTTAGTLLWKVQHGSFSVDAGFCIEGWHGDQLTISGASYSTKFAGIPIINHGNSVLLVARLDTLNGSIKWLKTLSGTQNEFADKAKIFDGNKIFVVGSTASSDYDFSGGITGGTGIMYVLNEGNNIRGTVFIDNNGNNVFDAGDKKPDHIWVQTSKNNKPVAVSLTTKGLFNLQVDTGTYNTTVNVFNSSYYTVSPQSFNCSFNTINQLCQNTFILKPVPGIQDLSIALVPLGASRPGFEVDYLLTGYNKGTTTIASGTVSLTKDTRLLISNFSTAPNFNSGDSVRWNFSNLAPLDSVRYLVRFYVPPPPVFSPAENITCKAYITPVSGDAYLPDNKLIVTVLAQGSYDPNAKTNTHGGQFLSSSVQAGEFIYYVIQFQNTGNAEAFDVVIKDTISTKLQLTTFEMVAGSHPYELSFAANKATWRFANINLPDSNSNEPGSHGFLMYKIKAEPTLVIGDTIFNRAGIYFDFNPPILTETDTLLIVENNFTVPIYFISVNAFSQDAKNVVTWKVGNEVNISKYVVERSADANTFLPVGEISLLGNNVYNWIDNEEIVGSMYYRIRAVDMNGDNLYSEIVAIKLSGNMLYNAVTIQPNPIKDHILRLKLQSPSTGNYYCSLFDTKGRLVTKKVTSISRDGQLVFNLGFVPAGLYYLSLKHSRNQSVVLKVIVE